MLIEVMLSEALLDPNIDLMEAGKDMIKARASARYCTMSCPSFDYSGKNVDRCKIAADDVPTTFPMIVRPSRGIN